MSKPKWYKGPEKGCFRPAHTDEAKAKMAEIARNRPLLTCWICGVQKRKPGLVLHLKAHERAGVEVNWDLLPKKNVEEISEQEKWDRRNARISAKQQGNKSGRGNKGKVRTEEQKRAHSEKMKDHIKSPETRAKLSAAHKARWARMTPEQRQEWVGRCNGKPSSLELIVAAELTARGVEFEMQKWFALPGVASGVYDLRPDFYVASQNLVIEIFGCYWHGCACRLQKVSRKHVDGDVLRAATFEASGYETARIWEHDIRDERLGDVLDALGLAPALR